MPTKTADPTSIKRRHRRKPTGAPVVLGGGPYSDPTNPWSPNPIREARARFLRALNELVPEVVTTLHADSFKAFLQLSYIPSPEHEQTLTWQAIIAGAPEDPTVMQLRHSLEEWARPLNLFEPWVLDSALVLLTRWWYDETNPTTVNWLTFRDLRGPFWWESQRREFLGYRLPFTFSHAGWDSTRQLRGHFRRGILQQFDSQLRNYLDRVEAIAKRVLEPAPRIPDPEHFIWTVQYQVKGENFLDIAKRDNVVAHDVLDKTVSAAVRKVLSLIDLPQRKGRSGRQPTRAKTSI